MDIFIPIFGMDEWIGVLALGPKTSGNSYTRSDFRLLETIADQTSVALQNARLVESIVRVNHEFRKAYAAMEVAHTKLERLDRTKSDFISIASHELRTPLTVLSGYSQMLLEDPKFVESDYYHKVIQGIGEGTSRLHEIVDNMLDIAKIDTRVLDLQAEPVSMGSLIHQVSIGFKEVISERNLDLTFENLEEVPPVVGDPEALKKVFYHLISNAIKYTPDYGAIKITASKLGDGDTRFPAGGVEVVVHDTGIGIDPRYQELIFTKFYQTGDVSLHSSGKTKFKGGGPGLGLAIVRGIVQAHGGRVWVESAGLDEENPPGSAFHVILPIEHQKY
jgi:signal transduction histidine kinase